jgi:hypothetical protein
MHLKLTSITVAAVLGASVFAPRALAVPLPPGGAVTPDDTTLPGSALLADTGALPFTLEAGVLSGTVRTRVFAPDAVVNPIGGGLIFAYDIVLDNNPPNTEAVSRITTEEWAGFFADARQVGLDGVLGPSTAGEADEADRSVSGDVIGFDFFPLGASAFVGPGASATLILGSDAPSYKASTVDLINGDTTEVDSYAPARVAVPDASSTLILLGMGLVGLGVFRKVRIS